MLKKIFLISILLFTFFIQSTFAVEQTAMQKAAIETARETYENAKKVAEEPIEIINTAKKIKENKSEYDRLQGEEVIVIKQLEGDPDNKKLIEAVDTLSKKIKKTKEEGDKIKNDLYNIEGKAIDDSFEAQKRLVDDPYNPKLQKAAEEAILAQEKITNKTNQILEKSKDKNNTPEQLQSELYEIQSDLNDVKHDYNNSLAINGNEKEKVQGTKALLSEAQKKAYELQKKAYKAFKELDENSGAGFDKEGQAAAAALQAEADDAQEEADTAAKNYKDVNDAYIDSDYSNDDISSTGFMIGVNDISPGMKVTEDSVTKSVNKTLGTIIQSLMMLLGSIALLIMTIGAGFMILHHGQDELLSKGKTIFMSGVFALVVALSSYYLVAIFRFILFSEK